MILLSSEETYVVWAALLAMVLDNHCAQDGMNETQWAAAEALYERINAKMNAKMKAPE